ncbi:MAG: hypothetical protein PWQ91_1828 [Eubacteriales bacterium]|nr:hypothetical protein [Eubacteriales bacterium]MDN5364763.1 hypothetical protein [Eubacteriales bacterium]
MLNRIYYTLQHILVMRLLLQYQFNNWQNLHDLLFLASAESLERHDLGFYDFIRTNSNVYSPILRQVVRELIAAGVVDEKHLALTPRGREIYYSLGSILRPYDDFCRRIEKIVERLGHDVRKTGRAVRSNIAYHRAKRGKHIFPEGDKPFFR